MVIGVMLILRVVRRHVEIGEKESDVVTWGCVGEDHVYAGVIRLSCVKVYVLEILKNACKQT